VLLSAAARREDGAVELTGKPKRAVARKAFITLLNDGLVEEVPALVRARAGRRRRSGGRIQARVREDEHARNLRATSASSSRSRFFVNTVGTHTGSSTPLNPRTSDRGDCNATAPLTALRADGVERLQQKRSQQPLRRDRRPSIRRVESRKFSVEGGKHFVDDTADQAQRMVPPPAWNQIRSSMSSVHHTFFSSLLV
jgi:hypothetical protein